MSGRASAGELRLHLGCGSTVVPGWENIDRSPNVYLARAPALRRALFRARVLTEEQATAVFPRGVVRHDVRTGLPYPEASVSHIYSSHMIEHLSRWRALTLVRECARVLVPGGVLRLATPDLGDAVDAYVQAREAGETDAADRFMQGLGTYQERPGSWIQRLARFFAGSAHQWLYDAPSLRRLLEEGGLEEVVVSGYRDGDFPDLELLETRPGGLFIEGRRR